MLPSLNTKKCTKCKVVQDINAFFRNKRVEDGRHYTCKECMWETRLKRNVRLRKINTKRVYYPPKECGRCGELKAGTEFYKGHTDKTGLQSYCKPCIVFYFKELRVRYRKELKDVITVRY